MSELRSDHVKPTDPSARRRLLGVPALGLLVLAMLVVSALAFQAYRAEEDQRTTTERALKEYAGFAAWEFASNAKEEMWMAMTELLRPVEQLSPVASGAELPTTEVLRKSEQRVHRCKGCAVALPAAYYFRLDLRTGALEIDGDEKPADPERRWLVDTVWQHASTAFKADWRVATIVGSPGGVRRTVAYTTVRDSSGECVAAYGVVSESGKFMAAISREMADWSLLPPTLMKKAGTQRLVAVTVSDDQGHVVYRSPWQFPTTFSAEYQLEKFVSGFSVQASLRPETADLMLVRTSPYRFPLLMALLLVTVALVAMAFRQLRREAALARLRADFVSSVSHELRTPLAQIRMFAELLRMGWVRSEEERTRSLEIIDQESRRLAQLVDRVLRFEKTERGESGLCREPTVLSSLAREVVEAFAPLAKSRNVSLRFELDDSVHAEVDRGAIRQVMINLLDNAVKYGPVGQTVTMGVTTHGAYARVAVEDEGPGVPLEHRATIWEPFQRLARDSNSAIAGSGIGLSVVRSLTIAHGGRVSVESGTIGARLIVDLPRLTMPVAAPSVDVVGRDRALART
jgi:signal transduction histidine kinase